MKETTAAVDREKAVFKTVQTLEEQFKGCPERVSVYEIGGCKYTVHSHFVGDKVLDEVMEQLAYDAAMKETVTA